MDPSSRPGEAAAMVAEDPFGFLLGVLSSPWGSFFFLLAAAIVVLLLALVVRPRASVRGDEPLTAARERSYRTEGNILAAGAVVLIVVFIGEALVRGYLLNMTNEVSWWAYALPVFVAACVLASATTHIVLRGSGRPSAPAAVAERRTWLSFGARGTFLFAGTAAVSLAATTLWAGAQSSPDRFGRHVWLEIPIPNTDVPPLLPWFYGWAYGVPVLVCLAVLALAVWMLLRANAARAYDSPHSVSLERAERDALASRGLRLAAGGVLLSLACAWRFIAEAGAFVGGLGVVGPAGVYETFEPVWRYSALAEVGGSAAPVIEIAAFVLLLTVAASGRGRDETFSEPPRAFTDLLRAS